MHAFADLQKDLLDDLKVEEHIITSDMDLPAINALWLKRSIWKKFQDELSSDADERCLKLFKLTNDRCRDFALEPLSAFEDTVIGEVKTIFDNLFHDGPRLTMDFASVSEGVDIGPGASLGSLSYNFYSKLFDGPLTCTSETLYRYYRYATSAFPAWRSAETARSLRYGVCVVEGNRLSFVPKTSAISRSICTEPLLNMFFQKGIGSVLEKMLKKKFRIDLSSQPDLNRGLARLGSITGDFATIDLSSASDSVSLNLLKEILPPYVLEWLKLARSPYVIFPDGTKAELHMVSSMGNAFTFPLQTIIFSAIVTSCYRVLGINPQYSPQGPKNFAVFGDDIIVRKDSYSFVVRCLTLFGFKVNEDKSFNDGYFRESCGGDFYKGHDIRGVYLKSLKTRADVYSAINRLIRWSSRTGVLLPKTVKRLMGMVKFNPVPYHAGDTEGIKVPNPPDNLIRKKHTGGVVYYALVDVPNKIKVPEDETKEWSYRSYGQWKAKATYNPDGLLVSFSGGYIVNSSIPLRVELPKRFKMIRRVTSSWGSSASGGPKVVESWCGYQPITSGFPARLSWLKSMLSAECTLLADRSDPRSDWEIVAALYL
jgi:hypothetical protein